MVRLGIFLVLAISATSFGVKREGKVSKITDGDTIWVDTASDTLKIRMLGIDAPEQHVSVKGGVKSQSPWGDQATAFLAKLIPVGTKVTVEDEGHDQYKRTLGRIFKGKTDINLEMVKTGWAIPYIICEGKLCNEDFLEREDVEEYLDACDEARSKKVGIYNPKNPLKEMPFEFRIRIQNRQPNKYVGEFSTKKVVEPEEYNEVDLCERVFFMRKSDIKKIGYSLK